MVGGIVTRRWLIWGFYLTLWTIALLLPGGSENWPGPEIDEVRKHIIAKSMHVSAYAGLAILSGWLGVPARFRFLLVFLMMAHGTVTELLQLHIQGRTGALRDVGFNNL